MIKAGIIGATGYAGAELVRILMGHKEVEIVWYGSRSYIDQKYASVSGKIPLESGTGYQCEESGGESGSIFQNYFRRGFTYSNDGTDSDRSVPEQCQ